MGLFYSATGLNRALSWIYHSRDLTMENLDPAIIKLDGQGLVPQLANVSVRVGGLAVGKGKQLTAPQILLIRKSWQLYFDRTGARFNPASLDGSVIE